MKINILTAVPEYFVGGLATSIIGRAQKAGLVSIEIISLRDFADGKRKKQVDDTPYGGGPGMVLKIEPIVRALDFLDDKSEKGQVWLTSPRGEIFRQQRAQQWSTLPYLTLICGHYEGVDERVTNFIDGQISLGEFVLTGGEPAAVAMLDATVRLLPGVLGNSESLVQESFCESDFLEYPQYTKPAEFRGLQVPEVLLSGDHGKVAAWRAQMAKKLS
ncbi:tRNA (guanosine(37)-N1)-methyltransferase TrmD [bacterium]|nr:tRNA (guanosine(37)-N1)-methyltransferase TrmD [bacterium]